MLLEHEVLICSLCLVCYCCFVLALWCCFVWLWIVVWLWGLACVGIYLCLVCSGLARLFRLAWLLLVSIWCWFGWIWYFGCCTMIVVLIGRF